MKNKILFAVLFLTFSFQNFIYAQDKNSFEFQYANHFEKDPQHYRSGWMPLFTFFVPGLGQFVEGKSVAGFTYSAYALAGLGTAAAVANKGSGASQDDLDSRNNRTRQYFLGSQMYQTAGALSMYQSFRSEIEFYREQGTGYEFIKSDDTALDLMTAPFQFHFLAQPTTYIPLGVGLIASILLVKESKNPAQYINGSDVGYLSAFSYQAGVSEEALFRGWLMPSFRNNFANDFWSNTLQATLFSLAHISSDNRYPVWQFGMGYYLGWLSQRSGWSLQENIFIHAWWDIIAFTSLYLSQNNSERKAVYLPLIQFGF